MKKIILFSLTGILLLGSATGFAFWKGGTKVAVFDLQQVLNNDPQVAILQAKIKKQFLPNGKKIVSSRKTLQTDLQTYRKIKNKKSDQAQKLAVKIGKEANDLFKQQSDLQRKLIVARNQALQILIKQIKTDVKGIAEKQHYDLVLTKTSVAYNADDIDITKQVEALVSE